MNIVTAREARANLERLIVQTVESHQPIHVTSKRGVAVILAEQDFNAMQETLHLLSVSGVRESIHQGMAEPLARNARKLDW